MRIVVALGGNALEGLGDTGSVGDTARQLSDLIAGGQEVVITHGNGPQVGELLLDQEARQLVADLPRRPRRLPLDVLVAMTQAELGYPLQRDIEDELVSRDDHTDVVTLVTEVVVDPGDREFSVPSKPVGPKLPRRPDDGHEYREVDGGWRRVVPSPAPVHLVERAALRAIVEHGIVPVCGGGGGVPVIRDGNRLVGVEAVIDKDHTSALVAADLEADVLLILTDVPAVERDHGTPRAQPLRQLSVAAARELADELPAGSMRPKVMAAARAASEGRTAIIAALGAAEEALAGTAGTMVVP